MQKISISGVILAGGVNRRFNGITKANILINGKKIISRIIDTIEGLFEEIIIVTNTPEEFQEFSDCLIISDSYLKVGPLGGIHAALKASSSDAVFVFAGDMPMLSRELIINQIEMMKSHECDILIPRFRSDIEPLHSIYKTSIAETLDLYLRQSKNFAVREFLKKVNLYYMDIETSEEAIRAFTNINSPADIERLKDILR